jgi:signal transduction histidine kinase
MSRASAARIGWSACGATVILVALAVTLLVIRGGDDVPGYAEPGAQEVFVGTALALAFAVLGALVVARRTAGPIGPLLCTAGVTAALVLACREWGARALLIDPGSLPAGEAMAWIATWAWIGTIPLAGTVIALLFPDGRLPSPRWRPALWFSIFALGAVLVGYALSEGSLEAFPGLENPVGFLPAGLRDIGGLMAPAVALGMASLAVRYRGASGDQRQQLSWIAAAACLLIALAVVEGLIGSIDEDAETGWLVNLGTLSLVAAAGVAVLRYRLYDLDLVVNRALVYGVLTALVVGAYVGLVTALGELLDSSGVGVSLIATAVVAVAIQPLRSLLQRRVDRLMYGDRDDPYRALSRLGERLGGTLDPDEVLPAVVETVAEGLRLPYVAIELVDADVRRAAASHGAPSRGDAVRLPLEHRGEAVGWLVVAPRTGSEAFAPADMRLLTDLARQAGVAAHAVRLTHDLRRSRERLVTAREEERRRLRRDLHDGLGPALAGIALEIESARSLAGDDPDAARELLQRLRGEVQDTLAEIRRIAHDLRPPALDELGLLDAVREHAARLGMGSRAGAGPAPNGLRIAVEVPERLPPLPAAVEVAAYRIALEAMTNVSRHAEAKTCVVRIEVDRELALEIRDDGSGINGRPRGGLGLVSMRERAEELGGNLSVGKGDDGSGTVVRARLPLEAG